MIYPAARLGTDDSSSGQTRAVGIPLSNLLGFLIVSNDYTPSWNQQGKDDRQAS